MRVRKRRNMETPETIKLAMDNTYASEQLADAYIRLPQTTRSHDITPDCGEIIDLLIDAASHCCSQGKSGIITYWQDITSLTHDMYALSGTERIDHVFVFGFRDGGIDRTVECMRELAGITDPTTLRVKPRSLYERIYVLQVTQKLKTREQAVTVLARLINVMGAIGSMARSDFELFAKQR